MTDSAESSRDESEIASFAAQADSWWDPNGPFAPLHAMNPTRISIISDILCQHFDRNLGVPVPFDGLRLTDIGCGGGLATEPFARLGFNVTGIDAAEENIHIAQTHATKSGLNIKYHVGSPEHRISNNDISDVVLALEVVEHVANIDVFISGMIQRLSHDGMIVFSTINRTTKSLVLAKTVAEYVLRWVPPGTHQWNSFVRPSEISRILRSSGFRVTTIKGIEYNLGTGEWFESDDIGVNYILSAIRE